MTMLFVLLLAAAPGEAEVARVQHHLRGAEALLASRDVSALTASQQANRRLNAQRLQAYREAGVFPKNRQQPGRTPVFRDEDGTRCAVGELLWQSGETALVQRIAATRNLATIHQLADEPGLADWLVQQGLTLEEAARIQPGYDFMSFEVVTPVYTNVAVGACSPPVTLRPGPASSGPQAANVTVTPAEVTLYQDAACEVPLPLNRQVSTDGSLFFVAPSSGNVTIELSNQGSQVTQVHRVLAEGEDAGTPADGGHVLHAGHGEVGCAVAPASSWALLALCLTAAWRRRRAS